MSFWILDILPFAAFVFQTVVVNVGQLVGGAGKRDLGAIAVSRGFEPF